MPIHYAITPVDLNAHQFEVTLTIAEPAPMQTVSLPVWIPGSYLVREFARHLHSLVATQAGRPLIVEAINKNTWRIQGHTSQSALQLRYRVYAFDTSVRTAWLDDGRGFFNPTSLCLRVHGQHQRPHRLSLHPPMHRRDWQAVTSLNPLQIDAQGFGHYQASDYDELADSPVEMGRFWRGDFDVLGIAHTFVVAGALPSFDSQRLLADTRAICEAAIRLWHPDIGHSALGIAPHDRYLFILNAVGDGYGGLEHRHSTALICKRTDLPALADRDQPANDAYRTLLGLISHEYFHTWNVKRLRPAEFAHYDYEQENYTRLLWFFEGFTSYYDDLLLRRAGLIDHNAYLQLLGKTWWQVQQTPGRAIQSVAEASFDAWIKYYRQDENTANTTVSYYTKGALVALCLDLSLRQQGQTTLDAVMQHLWRHSGGGPISEADILASLHTLSGRSWQAEINAWVHGTEELPVAPLLEQAGIAITHAPLTWAQRLGIQISDAPAGPLTIKRVQRHSPAEAAGISAGDEWLGLSLSHDINADSWRIHQLAQLDTLLPLAEKTPSLRLLLARDGRLLWRTLDLPAHPPVGQPALHMPTTGCDTPILHSWLGPVQDTNQQNKST